MAIQLIPLETIQDNPHNPRETYHKKDIDDLAHSIEQVGMLQAPLGRWKDTVVQLAFGGLRKRAYDKLAKKDPEKWGKMPLDIADISDQRMALYAIEENLRRHDISPMELARSVDTYLATFPDATEEELAKQLNMTQGNVSHMRRVLRLPEPVREKINEGRINFTMGRELLTLSGLADEKDLMLEAIRELKTETKPYGEPCTVEGMQKAIHSIAERHLKPLEKEHARYGNEPLFDTRAAGCLECDKMIRTHPNKSSAAHFCNNPDCWQQKQQAYIDEQAALARAKMREDVLKRAAEAETKPAAKPIITQVIKVRVSPEILSKIEASCSADTISESSKVKKPFKFKDKLYINVGDAIPGPGLECYQLVPKEEFKGEARTYRVPTGREHEEYYESLRKTPEGFYHGMLVHYGQEIHVLVGPPVTFLAEMKTEEVEKHLEARADARDRGLNAQAEAAAAEKEAEVETPPEVPPELLKLAEEKAGTRAEVLDLKDLTSGPYGQIKQGYVVIKGSYTNELERMDDPAECLERCTKGFHYGFDSRGGYAGRDKVLYICSDPKCVAQKKGALTRKRNAAGQALKNTEKETIKKVIDLVGQVASLVGDHIPGILAVTKIQTHCVAVPRSLLMLIIYNQLHGQHISKYQYGENMKAPDNWLWDKLSAGTAAGKRKEDALWNLIDKLTFAELVKLITEMMFYYLQDHGDVARYEIKTAKPLAFFGIEVPENTGAVTEREENGNEG